MNKLLEQLSSLMKRCGVWTLPQDFVSNYLNIEITYTLLPLLMQIHSGDDSVASGLVSLFPHLQGPWSCQCLSRDFIFLETGIYKQVRNQICRIILVVIV